MKENWYALLIAIFKDVDATAAVRYMKYGIRTRELKKDFIPPRPVVERKNGVKFSDSQIEEAIEYKKTHSWFQTGDYFNINPYTLKSKIFYYNKRKDVKPPTKANLTSNTIGLNNKPVTL